MLFIQMLLHPESMWIGGYKQMQKFYRTLYTYSTTAQEHTGVGDVRWYRHSSLLLKHQYMYSTVDVPDRSTPHIKYVLYYSLQYRLTSAKRVSWKGTCHCPCVCQLPMRYALYVPYVYCTLQHLQYYCTQCTVQYCTVTDLTVLQYMHVLYIVQYYKVDLYAEL